MLDRGENDVKDSACSRMECVRSRLNLSKDEDDHEYEFSVLSMRIRFVGQHFSKCGTERKTRIRSRVLRSKGS